MSEAAIQVQHLVKRYGDMTAVGDISFDVARGEIFSFLGPNGAGKTTTVEILETIRSATSGRLNVLGRDIGEPREAEEVRKKIGILPQDFSTLERLTVRENLEFFAGMYDRSVSVSALMEQVGIADRSDERFSKLSGGLKQRVGIAASLVNDPDLVFLDEPTTGLDPEARRSTWNLIQGLKARGKTVFLTTHYMEEAERLSDRIAIIVKGQIAAIDAPSALVARYGGGRSMVFTGGGDAVFGTLRRYFENVRMEGTEVVLPFEDVKDMQVALNALLERGLKVDMAVRTATIEDVFLKLAGFRMTEGGEAG
ncbi:MAG TPA: ABC transporter ATP-binding protein [Nitrososphaerales archaeon]|nr:ABC transporter ATP-binding protein [Nitrososphaerales archaeon]